MSSKPRVINNGGVHCGMGDLQRECRASPVSFFEANSSLSPACLPLPLHLKMAQDPSSVPARQPRLGVPKVRTVKGERGRQCWVLRGQLQSTMVVGASETSCQRIPYQDETKACGIPACIGRISPRAVMTHGHDPRWHSITFLASCMDYRILTPSTTIPGTLTPFVPATGSSHFSGLRL